MLVITREHEKACEAAMRHGIHDASVYERFQLHACIWTTASIRNTDTLQKHRVEATMSEFNEVVTRACRKSLKLNLSELRGISIVL